MRKATSLLVFTLVSASPVLAGVFLRAERSTTEPFIVVHPSGYDGTGGQIQLKVCATSPTARPGLQRAIETWNELSPTTGNCMNCVLIEDTSVPGSGLPLNMATAITHELGHCAMGLGHTNWGDTSFSNSQDAVFIDEGADMIRGSSDDYPWPLPGTRLVHWFRNADNNPVVIDSTYIDADTYTRRILDLPTGHSWPANANRDVAAALGFSDTQAIMYSDLVEGEYYTGLSADDVNTVKFGMAGLDMQAATADDYTVELQHVGDCSIADIEVRFEQIDGPMGPVLGTCVTDIEAIGTGSIQMHYRLAFDPLLSNRIYIQIDSEEFWDIVFADDFESGDFSGWSQTVP